MNIADRSLGITGLFEAEILTELLLWRWDHPFKNDPDFRNDLLETAALALHDAVAGQPLFDTLPPAETNLIAALYYAEWSALNAGEEDPDGLRRKWLEKYRAAIPSCFAPQSDLPP